MTGIHAVALLTPPLTPPRQGEGNPSGVCDAFNHRLQVKCTLTSLLFTPPLLKTRRSHFSPPPRGEGSGVGGPDSFRIQRRNW